MPSRSARRDKLRVFFDADVLLSGAAPRSRQSASFILLQLSELTILEGVCSPFVVEQVRRNLRSFLPRFPQVEQEFLRLQKAALIEVPDPSEEDLEPFHKLAHQEDLPVLVAAVRSGCRYLLTRNLRHYPKRVEELEVIEPGRLVRRIRERVAGL
jgi:hypothetical protein